MHAPYRPSVSEDARYLAQQREGHRRADSVSSTEQKLEGFQDKSSELRDKLIGNFLGATGKGVTSMATVPAAQQAMRPMMAVFKAVSALGGMSAGLASLAQLHDKIGTEEDKLNSLKDSDQTERRQDSPPVAVQTVGTRPPGQSLGG